MEEFMYLRKAQYHETDQMGFIHHSNYIKWMEEARVAFMDQIGMGYAEVEKAGVVSPVTAVSVEYKKPVRFSEEVGIQVTVLSYSGVRLELEYRFFLMPERELCTTAISKHCFLKDGRIVSLKRQMPELDQILSGFSPR